MACFTVESRPSLLATAIQLLRTASYRVQWILLWLTMRINSIGHPETATLSHPHYSHSMVLGGFDEISYTTRLIPRTSLMILFEITASTSGGMRNQSAVMPS